MDPSQSQPFPTSGSSPGSSTEHQALPPAQLEFRQADSHKRKIPHSPQRPSSQSRQHPTEPRIIYETPPKVIHTNPKDFKAIVQRLTGWDGRASSPAASTSSSSQVVRNKREAASSSNAGRLMDKSPAARDVVMDDQMNANQRFLIGDCREQGQHCNLGSSSSQVFGYSIGGSSSSNINGGLMSNNISQAARYAVMDDQMNLNQRFLIGDHREQGQHFCNLGSSSSQVFDIGGSSSSNNISNNDISSAALFAANMNSNQPFLIGNHHELCDNNIGGSSSFNNGGLMMSNNNISQQAARYAVMEDDQMNANQQFFIRDNREQGQHCNILGSSSSQLLFDDNIIGGTNNGVLMSNNNDISQAAQYSVMDDPINSNQRFLIGDHREQGQHCMLGSSSSSSQLFDDNIGGSSSSDIIGVLMSNPASRYAVMDDQMNSNQRFLTGDHHEQGHYSNLGSSSSSSHLFDNNIGGSSISNGDLSNNIYQPVTRFAVMDDQMNSNKQFLIGDNREQGQHCMLSSSSSSQVFDEYNIGGSSSGNNGGMSNNVSDQAARYADMEDQMNSNQRFWIGDHREKGHHSNLGSSSSDLVDNYIGGSSSSNGGQSNNIYQPVAQYAVMDDQMNSNQRFLIGDNCEQRQHSNIGSSSSQLFDNYDIGLGGSSSNDGLINISPAAAMDQIMNSNQRVWIGDHHQQLGGINNSVSDQQDHMFLGSSSSVNPNNAPATSSFYHQGLISPVMSNQAANNINFMDAAPGPAGMSGSYDSNQAANINFMDAAPSPSNYSNMFLSADPSITSPSSSYSNLDDHFNKFGDLNDPK